MALWSGSLNSADVLSENYTQAVREIEYALDSVNSTDVKTYKTDIALMGFMIKEIEGVAGTYEVFKDFQSLFQDDTEHLDPEEFEETYAKWTFGRKGYAIKTGSFDKKTFKDAIERNLPIEKQVADRTISILADYKNKYIPNIIFDTILTVPTAGGGFYEDNKFGFVRNTTINKSKLISYDPNATAGGLGSVVRNNYRAIASNIGVTENDIKFVKQYMGEIEGVDEENLIMYGNADAIGDFQSIYGQYSPVREEITVNGVPTGLQDFTLRGFTLVVTKSLPPKTLLIVNPDSKAFITKLVSPKPEFRGIAIETVDNGDKLISDVKSFMGAKILIQEEGLTNYYC